MARKSIPQYYGSIPTIAKAFENDPRTKLAQTALAGGTSGLPVAQGGWAITDGLARVGQALAGAYGMREQEKRYGEREADFAKQMQAAAATALQPQPGAVAPPVVPRPAMEPGQGPVQTVDPGSSSAPQQPSYTPPGGGGAMPPPMGSGGPPSPVFGASAPVPLTGMPIRDPAEMVAANLTTPNPAQLYRFGIRPIEGGTDPKTGAFRTSPKGAVGPAQVMPGTAREAAQLAGLPYDEKRYRSDTAYNDALGEAYYGKQLADFGDPLKAAAAYNAGPARVRRAVRRANTTGTDWTQHLPAETQNYIQSFAAKVGNGATGFGATDAVAPLLPGQEEVPDAPEPPSAQRPDAPELPAEVQTNRIAMAQSLLSSGNPDLVAIAQEYLDKGLTEQNDARMLRSQQQFTQSQTGYNTDLEDWKGARNDARQDGYMSRRDARERNFKRTERYADQTFQSQQNAVDRRFRKQERIESQLNSNDQAQRDRDLRVSEGIAQRTFDANENTLERENRLAIAGIRSNGKGGAAGGYKNPYWTTVDGRKRRDEIRNNATLNNNTIGDLQEYIALNDQVSSGGLKGYIPFRGAFDSRYARMDTIAKQTTLAALGGKLGGAISDSDRKFIAEANINAQNPQEANRITAEAKIFALKRSSDLDYFSGQAEGEGPDAVREFNANWRKYIEQNSVKRVDKNGKVQVADYVPFEVWMNRSKLKTVR